MKFRSDFVTNSSSSSFIIGKSTDEDLTLDSVFCMVRDIYKDYIEKIRHLVRHADDYNLEFSEGRFKIKEDEEKYKGMTPEERGSAEWDERRRIDRKLQEAYGIDTWETIFDFNTEAWKNDQLYPWLEFDTYAQYQEYWLDRIRASDPSDRVHAPFSIYDYLHPQDDYIELHEGYYGINEPSDNEYLNLDVFGWYVPCGDHRLEGRFDDSEYDYCPHCDYAAKHDEKCRQLRRDIQSEDDAVKITKTNCVAMVLGRFCVRSECGYITQYVVDALVEKSRYCCNHMG